MKSELNSRERAFVIKALSVFNRELEAKDYRDEIASLWERLWKESMGIGGKKDE